MQSPKAEPEEAFYYKSKDKKSKWCTVSDVFHDEPRTMFESAAKVKGRALEVNTPEQCFHLFFTPEIISRIVELTNDRIDQVSEPGSREDTSHTDAVEINAFLGLLILSGLCLYENIRELWDSSGFGIDMFRTTLGVSRFLFLLRCFHFVEDDSVSNVTDFINTFNKHCHASLELSSYATIEEQFIPFRGECPEKVKQYSQFKRYGIRFVAVTDSRLNYTHSMLMQHGDAHLNDIVIKLTSRLHSSNRLILTDKRFSNKDLVDHFSAYNVFFLGEIKHNASEVPPEFSSSSIVSEGSSVCVYHQNLSLICHVPKKDQCVLLLSNLHGVRNSIDDVIETYEALAGQPDIVDSMCKTYSCTKRTKRWDLPIFFRLVDVACINAQIIYTINNPSDNLTRRSFIKALVTELVKSQLVSRVNQANLNTATRQAAAKLAKLDKNPPSLTEDFSLPPGGKDRRRRCQFCPRPSDCKSAYFCHGCKRPLCRKRAYLFCRDCVNIEAEDTAEMDE